MTSEDFYALASVVVAFFLGAALLTPILALSARFALKPVMETWMRLRQSETTDQEKILQDRRVALLEAEVQSLQQLIQQRVAAQEFDRALSTSRSEPPEATSPGHALDT
jgi:hypothetical protein